MESDILRDSGSREPGAGSREPGAGSREPGAGSREPGAGSREPGAPPPVFGLSPEWLLAPDGTPVADALVLSHPEQVDRLREACPQAAGTAVLAGDPCFDRMLAARRHRERFRRALGVRRGQRLVVLNSTWNPESLFGDGGGEDVLPLALPRLTAELPVDEYRLAAILHPNIWYGHGPGQVRAWLDRARRGGLTLVDPLDGWRQALIAADALIGDHGAVTYYSAALGTPVVLGAAPVDGLDPRSPAAEFVRSAPRFDVSSPRAQLEALLADHRPLDGPAQFTTSVPGESAARLRRLFYGMMKVPEPDWPASLEPLPLPPYDPPQRTAPLRVFTQMRDAGGISVRRYADPPYGIPSHGGETHTAVPDETRDTNALDMADVILRHGSADDPRLGGPARWTAEVLAEHPHSSLAAYVTGPDSCFVRTRHGTCVQLAAGEDGDADPAVYASAVHAWLSAGRTARELADRGLTVSTGSVVHRVSVTPVRD